MFRTKIEWTDSTWSPIRGCSPVSTGCDNCWAARIAGRYSGEGQTYFGVAEMKNGQPRWNGNVQLTGDKLLDPLSWTGRLVYVGGMTDPFYASVKEEWLDLMFGIMALSSAHVYQLLTKRPEAMLDYFKTPNRWKRIEESARATYEQQHGESYSSTKRLKGPMRHLWLGVSAEDQPTFDERVRWLKKVPAALRWVAAEPLLGPINFRRHLSGPAGIKWVVVSGESGQGARPINPSWVRGIQAQTVAAKVPLFFKQWGGYMPSTAALEDEFPDADHHEWPDGETMLKLPKSDAATMIRLGNEVNGVSWTEMPPDGDHARANAHLLLKGIAL